MNNIEGVIDMLKVMNKDDSHIKFVTVASLEDENERIEYKVMNGDQVLWSTGTAYLPHDCPEDLSLNRDLNPLLFVDGAVNIIVAATKMGFRVSIDTEIKE